MAFGLAYLDYPHIRGAYGLSGIGVLPTAAELVVQPLTALAVAHARALLLPPPQPAIIKDNTNIMANRPIFSIKSPSAETVIETDRYCPQLDDWTCRDEVSASGLTSASCYHVLLIAFLPADVGFINLYRR